MSRKAGKLEVARERLQPLTSEELAQVTGGWCGPEGFYFFNHRRPRHYHHWHHKHPRYYPAFFGCGPQGPYGTEGFNL